MAIRLNLSDFGASQSQPAGTGVLPRANSAKIRLNLSDFGKTGKQEPEQPLLESTVFGKMQTDKTTLGETLPVSKRELTPQEKTRQFNSGMAIEPAKPQSWSDKLWDTVKGPFVRSGEEEVARSQNVSAIKNILDNQYYKAIAEKLGKDQSTRFNTAESVRQNIGEISKKYGIPAEATTDDQVNKNFDALTKELGMRGNPTMQEVIGGASNIGLMTFGGGALLAGGSAIAKFLGGLAGWQAATEAKGAVISAAKGEQFNPLQPEGFVDVLPDNSSELAKGLAEIADFVTTAKIAHVGWQATPKIAESLTKDITTKYSLPNEIYIDGTKIREMQTNADTKIVSSEEQDIVKSLGMNGSQWKAALKNGVTVKVPMSKVVTIADKPYWSKIKNAFGMESKPQATVSGSGKPVVSPIRGYLPGAGDQKADAVPVAKKEESATSKSAIDLQKQFEVRLAEQLAREKEMRTPSQTPTISQPANAVKRALDEETPITGVMRPQTAQIVQQGLSSLPTVEDIAGGSTLDLANRVGESEKLLKNVAEGNDADDLAAATTAIRQDNANLILAIGDYAVKKAREAGVNLGEYNNPNHSSDRWAKFIGDISDRIKIGIKNKYDDKIEGIINDAIQEYVPEANKPAAKIKRENPVAEKEVSQNEKYEKLESESYETATKKTTALISEYEKKEGNFLGGDNIKAALFEEYNKDRTNYLAFRKASNYLWNKIFDKWLIDKRGKANNGVLIMVGAPAVGKTTAAYATLGGKDFINRYSFVIESTGHDQALIDKTIKRIEDAGFDVHIVQVYTNPDVAFERMLKRAEWNDGANNGMGRTVHIPEYVNRVTGSIAVGRNFAADNTDPNVGYGFIENAGNGQEIKMDNPEVALDILPKTGYNKGDTEALTQKYYAKTIQIFKQGKISEAVYNGVTGLSGSPEERTNAKYQIDRASTFERNQGKRENGIEEPAISTPPVSGKPEGGFNLAQEARKYKTAEEFVRKNKSIYSDYSDEYMADLMNKTDASFQSENTQREFIRGRKDWNTRALREENENDIYNKIKQSRGTAIADYISDSVKYQKSQLTDIWNEANKKPAEADFVAPEEAKGIKNGGSRYANMGLFSDGTPVKMGNMDKIMPVETPELVKLVVDLTGKFPSVRKRFGRARGRFYPGTGEVKLRADIFADPVQAAKTLAHEIGHLVDWLPDKAMERGNIIGRLFTLRDFLKKTYGTTETLFGKEEGGFPDEIKQAIRNRVTKHILRRHNITFGEWVSGKVDKNTRQIVGKEINDEARATIEEEIQKKGFIKDETIRKELWDVSTYWRPLGDNPSADFMAYRKSSPELYADALSVLLNSPGTLEEKAPTFYKLFFQELNNKPEVHEAYWAIQDLLHGAKEELYLARQARMHAGQARAIELEKQYEAKREAGEKHLWTRFVQLIDDKNFPLLKKVSEAEKAGKIIPEDQNPRYVLEELSYMQNDNYLMIDEMNSKISESLKAAGLNDQDFGDYLELNRDIMGRFDKANPGGFDPKLAAEQLEFMKKNLGAEKFAVLEEKAKIFHEIVFRAVEEGARVGTINDKTFKEVLLPNKDNYAAFRVVDHLTDRISGTIKKQIGTFKEIKNPYYSTIQTTAALNNLNNIQKAKNSVRDFLAANFPDEISKSRAIRDKRLSIFKAGEGKEKLEMLENGRMASYDVDPMIAEIFNRESVATVNLIGRIMNTVFVNNITKSLFTTWNAGFTIFNLKRDASATFKAIPKAGIIELTKAYGKVLPSAYRFARGKLDKKTRPLVEGKMIATPQSGNAYSNENEMDIIERRFGLQEKDSRTKRFVLARPIISFFEGVSIASNTLEVLSKIAGTELRAKYGESGKTLAHNVRTYTGTPNYKVRGSATAISNEIWLFSNIMIKGMKRDWQLGTDPKTRGGYWTKTVLIDILPKLLMAAALYGVFGQKIKDQFEKMSEYDKTNYIVIPLGEDSAGKAIYARLPHDEFGQVYSALFWKMITAPKNEEDATGLLADLFGFMVGRGPGVTPAITTGANWIQFAKGKNPYDDYRGRNIIDQTTFTAGGWASTKKMIEWTANNYGLTAFTTYDPAKNTTFESTMQLLPGINRIFKISDYGQVERENKLQQESDKQRARELLQEKDVINNYAIKYRKDKAGFDFDSEADNAVRDILGHDPETEDEENRAKNIKAKFKKEILKKAGSAIFKSIAYAQTNKEKLAILGNYKSKVGKDEYESFLSDLYDEKLISKDVYSKAIE
jgi:hypothetical protein